MIMKKTASLLFFPLFVLAARFIPFDRLPSTCAFLHITGYPCPTCGMTRSVMAIVRGDIHRAYVMNPLGFLFMGVLGLWWVNSIYQALKSRQSGLGKWASRNEIHLIVYSFFLVMIFGLLRIVCIAKYGINW